MNSICVVNRNVLLATAFIFIFSGCSFKKNMMVDTAKFMGKYGKKVVNKYPDPKQMLQAMPAMIVQSDMFIEMAPNDPQLLLSASELNAGYALLIKETDKKRSAKYYKKAKEYALRILKRNYNFNRTFNKSDEKYAKALLNFEKEDVPALFALLTSTLGWITTSASDNAYALLDVPKAAALMERILILDDTYKFGGAHAVVGTYNAARAVMIGGNPEKAKLHFDKAFQISERKFLLWLVYYAQYYAFRIQDRELFVKTLNEVISAPDNLLPEQNLANEIAKFKAVALLKTVDEQF
jgi:tetratricopeptide (TPR) repeat protein